MDKFIVRISEAKLIEKSPVCIDFLLEYLSKNDYYHRENKSCLKF